MTFIGTVRHGCIELPPEIELPEGAQVRVDVSTDLPASDAPDPMDRLSDEAVSTGIADLAAQHDHYLYGLPKRSGRP